MNDACQKLMRGRVTAWFPLVPRPRPPCRALPLRVAGVRDLAQSASRETSESPLSSAAEALNKAALIASDCDLDDLARELCWSQFGIFRTAMPLDAPIGKLALQPIVNLGRLLLRGQHSDRAHAVFQNAYDAMEAQAATKIDGMRIDFHRITDRAADRQELCRFLWTVLLADGIRALTTAGRWNEALKCLEQHKGIGKRMLDGRQVAILARCAAGDCDGAIDLLDTSAPAEPWEEAVAAVLRTLCLRTGCQPSGPSSAAMTDKYLRLDPTAHQHPVFMTRLGLCVLDLAADPGGAEHQRVSQRILREAAASADAHVARDVLYHGSCRSTMTDAVMQALSKTIETSGLHRGALVSDQVDGLKEPVQIAEAKLTRLLAREADTSHRGGL